MLLELAKPISFLLCLYSLLTVFHRVFFAPGGSLVENGSDALLLLMFAGGIAAVSGVLFSEAEKARGDRVRSSAGAARGGNDRDGRWDPNLYPGLYRGFQIVSRREVSASGSFVSSLSFETVFKTLPVQVFLWATGLMAVLFVGAWYMETYFLPYRHVRW